MMGLGYNPQKQALSTMRYCIDLAKIPASGRQTGAELYSQLGATGLESLMQSGKLASLMRTEQGKGMLEALFRDDGNIIKDIIDIF